MIRGTTPTLMFRTPYEANMVKSGFITFTMRGDVILDIPVDGADVIVMDNIIQLKLTQAQTLSFDVSATCLAQIRLVLADDNAVASNIVKVPIGKILKEGEI